MPEATDRDVYVVLDDRRQDRPGLARDRRGTNRSRNADPDLLGGQFKNQSASSFSIPLKAGRATQRKTLWLSFAVAAAIAASYRKASGIFLSSMDNGAVAITGTRRAVLPTKEAALERWQLEARCLLAAAEWKGLVMMARIATLQALTADQVETAPTLRKKPAKNTGSSDEDGLDVLQIPGGARRPMLMCRAGPIWLRFLEE